MVHETKSSGERRLRMLCPRIPGFQIRETLQAMDDVMGADAASARDNLSRAHWQFTRNNCSGRGRGCWGSAIIPIPREATSVATMMGLLPVLNSFRTQSRSFCCLSPWIAVVGVSDGTKTDMTVKLTQRRPSVLTQESCDLIGNTLGTREN